MSLKDSLKPLPAAPGDDAALADVLETLTRESRATLSGLAPTFGPIVTSAPYLKELLGRHGDWLAGVIEVDPETVLEGLFASMREAGRQAADEDAIGKALRVAKARAALFLAVAEIGGALSTAQATCAISDIADAALEAALDFEFRMLAAQGKLREGAAVTAENCGLAIFALGKHGGRELNFSSDIDIVAFYDRSASPFADESETPTHYTKAVRHVAARLSDRTDHGYVFRTDLRLRPDPGSTPVAISVGAALVYYESRGQNWERAAWIKARCCAGDRQVGASFLKDMAPFVWRKHLDFATIADIQAMKRQINIHRNVGGQRLLGHNTKLGRGGIREIEFFVQTQQLIAGGRDPELRVRPTADALEALVAGRWIGAATARDLEDTYWFLRAVENRLQMLRDEQTHTMPETEAGARPVARLMGFDSLDAFSTAYIAALNRVTGYYSELFAEGESLATEMGDLVFTGTEEDPGTLETLAGLGFSDPRTVSATIRKWHYGGYAATRTATAREHLTELMPALLKAIAESRNADAAFARFDDFLSRLPAGVQMFALLRSHPHLLQLLIDFMASAPRLSEAVIHRAHVVDGLIDPQFAGDVASPEALTETVDTFLSDSRSYEDMIDRARIIGQEQKFMIAAALVGGALSAEQAGRQFTILAETLIRRLFRSVSDAFAQRHGRIPGARAGLLAFGKAASAEMTLTSDLDLILLYDLPEGAEASDGARPLDPPTYFARLTQRFVAAISAPTAEGVLYAVDMRLRPSGNAGPLATSLNRFRTYQRTDAWTWEHLALSRARMILADEGLAGDVEAEIRAILAAPRDREKIAADVRQMRALMAEERPPRHPFDLKLMPGGLVDLEFIAQTAQVLEADRIDRPQAPPGMVLRRLAEVGLLPEGERLSEIYGLYFTVLELMSACLVDPFKDEGWTPAFRELLARRANYPDFARLEVDIKAMAQEVQAAEKGFYPRIAGQG